MRRRRGSVPVVDQAGRVGHDSVGHDRRRDPERVADDDEVRAGDVGSVGRREPGRESPDDIASYGWVDELDAIRAKERLTVPDGLAVADVDCTDRCARPVGDAHVVTPDGLGEAGRHRVFDLHRERGRVPGVLNYHREADVITRIDAGEVAVDRVAARGGQAGRSDRPAAEAGVDLGAGDRRWGSDRVEGNRPRRDRRKGAGRVVGPHDALGYRQERLVESDLDDRIGRLDGVGRVLRRALGLVGQEQAVSERIGRHPDGEEDVGGAESMRVGSIVAIGELDAVGGDVRPDRRPISVQQVEIVGRTVLRVACLRNRGVGGLAVERGYDS